MIEARRFRAAMAAMVLGIALAGCGASTNLSRPCCYKGDVALTHLGDTRLVLETGDTVPFDEVFTDFGLDASGFGRVYPFREAIIRLVTFPSLRGVLPKYDANEDGYIQEPELTALYVQEAARGLGYAVARIEPSGETGAIVTSRGDISALVRFVERHVDEMARPQQRIFRDLDWLSLDDAAQRYRIDEVIGGF